MNSRVQFVVHSIDICTFTYEEIDNQTVSRNNRQMEWSISFFIRLVEKIGIGTYDLFNTI